jgi:hypothetical protein
MNINYYAGKIIYYIKRFVIVVFNIKTYETEVERLNNLRKIDKEMMELYEETISYYSRELKELEHICKEPLSVVEAVDRIKHSSYAQGRKDAYSQMGIKALNARVDGNTLLVDEEGKLIEVITTPTLEEVCMDEGIDINELENVS